MTRNRPLLLRLAALLAFAGALAALPGAASGATEPAPGSPPLAPAHPRAGDEISGTLNLGNSLTDRGDYESAEIAFRQVLDGPPGITLAKTQEALLGLARMHRRQGAYVKSVAIYEKFLKEYPGDERTPDILLELGRLMRSMGSHRLAIAQFYNVINSTLKLPDKGFDHYQQLAKTAQFEIAETHFQSGNFVEAAKFFSRLRLLDLVPADRARAHFKAAYALNLQGDHEGAVTMLRSFLEQWPDDENVPEARYLLATSLRQTDRPQEALVAALDLLRTEKSRVGGDAKRWAYWQRRTGNQLANDFFEHGDIHHAEAIYTGLAALSEDPAWRLPVLYQIALCDERLGRTDRAHLAYQDIVDATKATTIPELLELGRMAAWRLAPLDWNDTVRKQVTRIFETSTGRMPPPAPPKHS